MTLTCGSLFSGGIDGLAIAFSLAGFEIAFHVEIDEFNRRLLKKHASLWPHSELFADIRHVGKHNLRRVDVLCGGFPCQDVSYAGNRAGMGEGTRSGLWSEFRRVIGEIQPRIVVIENVQGLLTPIRQQKRAVAADDPTTATIRAAYRTKTTPAPILEVIAELAEMGYMGRWGVVSAADAGAPHQRNRVFMVAYADSLRSSLTKSESGPLAYDGKRDSAPFVGEWRYKFYAPFPSRFALADFQNAGLQRAKHGRINPRKTQSKTAPFSGLERSSLSRLLRRNRRHRSKNAKSGLGRSSYGVASGVDIFRGWPARPGEPQKPHEPPRTVLPRTVRDRRQRLIASGNGIVWQCVYPIALSIRYLLEEVAP